MDQARFDAIARALGGGMSRRGVLAAALAALPAAGALAQENDPAAAKKKRDRCRKDSPEGQCCTNKHGCQCDNGGTACGAECCVTGSACIEGACLASMCDCHNIMVPGGDPYDVFAGFFEQDVFAATNFPTRIVWYGPGSEADTWSKQEIGTEGKKANQFDFLTGIAGNQAATQLLAVDDGANRVSVWTRPNAASTAWTWAANFGDTGPKEQRLTDPIKLALTADERTALVAEKGRVSIWRRSAADRQDWAYVGQVGSGARGCQLGAFNLPQAIAISQDNLALFVANCSTVQVWTRPDQGSDDWKPVAEIGAATGEAMKLPSGIAADPAGRSIWVVDVQADRVIEWASADATWTRWNARMIFGSEGDREWTQFIEPRGINVSVSGKIRVSDVQRRRISIWTGCGA